MSRKIIETSKAPAAIGTYSQAVRSGNTVYISGQIPLDPDTGELVSGDIEAEIRRAFDNLRAIAVAAGGDLDRIVRLQVYLLDMADFPAVNQVMGSCFDAPFPARAAVGVAALPRGARVEIDAILEL